jgi:hypothetical protein
MGVVRFCSAGVAAVLLALVCQPAMAQGLLAIEPHPLDSLLSPYPVGPLQKFGARPPAGEARFSPSQQPSQQAAAPRERETQPQAQAQAQAQRRPGAGAEPRHAPRTVARRHEPESATAGSVLALAPRHGERRPAPAICFSTLHVQQDARCNVGVPTYRGRFEELLAE